METVSELKVGDLIRDNDPRAPFVRTLEVRTIENGNVWAAVKNTERQHWTRISLDRIFTDDKPRRSGWSLLKGRAP